MVIAVPKEGVDPNTEPDFNVISNPKSFGFKTKKVDLSMPKFKFEKEIGLKEVLKSLGVDKIFSSGAIGKRIMKEPAVVSEVRQRAVIEVDEKGTKAAAVTMVSMLRGCGYSPPLELEEIRVVADKPFNFYVVYDDNHRGRDFLLFAGKHNQVH